MDASQRAALNRLGIGCLVVLALVALTCWRCSVWCDNVTADARREREAREQKEEDDRRHAEEKQKLAAQQKQAEQQAKIAAAKKADEDEVKRLAALKPWERSAAIVKACPAVAASTCDDHELDLVIAAGATDAEKATLTKTRDSAVKQHEAAVHEAERVLQCCDGSTSGCLCQAPSHRGCCSHHGGVCGCAP